MEIELIHLLIARLTLVKEDLLMLLDNQIDYILADADNINATLDNVNRALRIVKELETETKTKNLNNKNMELLKNYKIEVYKNNSGIETIDFKASDNEEAIKELKSYINPYDNENSNKYELDLFCAETDKFIHSIKTNYYT